MFCGIDSEHEPHENCRGFASKNDWNNTRSVFCHRKDGGILTYKDDEYGSLAQGGSYEIWECSVHGVHHFMLPD